MCEPGEDKKRQVGDLMVVFCEHTCGAIDARDCNAMKHMILAEIRKSNAPSWVAQETEKEAELQGILERHGREVCPPSPLRNGL